jgi:V/A-type H+-transporting ATPase subunit F
MKMYVISDNIDTLIGLRMTGADGIVVHSEEEVKKALDRVLDRKDIGILLINGALASLCRERIDDIKTNKSQPLLVEIPDRHGNGRDENAIAEYIRTAVGIKI